jgi:hypothetical protein
LLGCVGGGWWGSVGELDLPSNPSVTSTMMPAFFVDNTYKAHADVYTALRPRPSCPAPAPGGVGVLDNEKLAHVPPPAELADPLLGLREDSSTVAGLRSNINCQQVLPPRVGGAGKIALVGIAGGGGGAGRPGGRGAPRGSCRRGDDPRDGGARHGLGGGGHGKREREGRRERLRSRRSRRRRRRRR